MKKRNIFLLSLAAIIALAVTWSLAIRFYYQHKFNQRVAELKAQGFPVSLADLEKAYVLPEGVPNAADLYLEAFAHYQEPNEAEKELLPYVGNYELAEDNSEVPLTVLAATSSFLDKNRQTLDLLDDASKIQTCLWPRTRQECMFLNENFRRMKDAVELLQLRTFYLTEMKETGNVYQSLKSTVALADAIQEQAFLIDHLVRIALKHLSVATLTVALERTVFEDQQLTFLQKEFAEMIGLEDMHNAFITDRVFGIEFVPLSYEQKKRTM